MDWTDKIIFDRFTTKIVSRSTREEERAKAGEPQFLCRAWCVTSHEWQTYWICCMSNGKWTYIKAPSKSAVLDNIIDRRLYGSPLPFFRTAREAMDGAIAELHGDKAYVDSWLKVHPGSKAPKEVPALERPEEEQRK